MRKTNPSWRNDGDISHKPSKWAQFKHHSSYAPSSLLPISWKKYDVKASIYKIFLAMGVKHAGTPTV